MIKLLMRFGGDVINIIIKGNNLLFTDSGGVVTTIEGLRISRAGVLKEFPELENNEEWKKIAIKRLKELKSKQEKEFAKINEEIKSISLYFENDPLGLLYIFAREHNIVEFNSPHSINQWGSLSDLFDYKLHLQDEMVWTESDAEGYNKAIKGITYLSFFIINVFRGIEWDDGVIIPIEFKTLKEAQAYVKENFDIEEINL